MLPSETMIWQPEFTDKTLSRKTGAVQREQAMQEQRLARKIALKLSGCVRADKAASLGSLCCKKKEEVERKQNRIYYRKPRSEMGVTCVGCQKMKLGSKPLI
ncbi:phage regulatory protein N [Escherichia coli]|nr:phage regulatory protein N [Escherichia coli]